MEQINSLIPTWIQERKKYLDDPRSVWEWVKYNIKKHSRKYSTNSYKQRKAEEQLLNKDFQDAFLISQNDPSQENLATLNLLKERTEKYYEEKVEGINVRSRARWHEHGERNSKYFLKLVENKSLTKGHGFFQTLFTVNYCQCRENDRRSSTL